MDEKIELEGDFFNKVSSLTLNNNPQLNLDDISDMNYLEIERFFDERGFNLQCIAAERGHVGAVNALINRGVEFDCEVEGQTPVDLAYANKHYEVVLNLLKSNFQFPHNFDAATVPAELQNFTKLTSEVHQSIVQDEAVKLTEILAQNTELRYIYDVTNKSAIRAAIDNRRFQLYEVLLTNKIYPAPHDDMALIVEDLSIADRRQLREINEALSSSVLAEPMATFMQNSFFGPDCPDRILYQNFIYKAYFYLLQIDRIAKLFNVVAATRIFKIVYDMKRETVSNIDPTSEPYTNGLFYLSGKIYIGGKGLLDPNKFFQVLGVIAHEICHYATLLTYDNEAKPYYEKDKAGERKFNGIVQECEAEMDKEELISLVFDAYPESLYHAETIVRVPHMVAQYHENQEVLVDRIQTFPSLFGNYDEDVMPEMDRALPRIKKKYRTKGEKKLERQRRLTILLSVLLALFVVASVPIGMWLKGLNYSWDTLTEVEKAKVNNATINYYGVEVQFSDLFTNDSDVYQQLNSKQIEGALEGNPKDLNMAVNTTYHYSIVLKWVEMPVKLRDKVLSTNLSFQGANIPMNDFLSNESLALPLLTSLDLKNILSSSDFEVASRIENNLKFYQERKFADENCKELPWNRCASKFTDEIIDEVSESKKFVLASKAGEGKTTTMKQFALVLKEKYPSMWIQEVELKKHLQAYRNGEKLNLADKKVLANYLADDLINSTDLNREVFIELFEKNHVVFMWDGADEIFPRFKDFMMSLAKNIANLTKNWQCISTREEYSNDFRKNLNTEPFRLVLLDENERFELLLKYIATSLFELDAEEFYENFKSFQNVTEFSDKTIQFLATFNDTTRDNITSAVVRGKNTLKSIETSSQYNNFITNPLLVRMVAETAGHNEGLVKVTGIYSLYNSFVNKKHAIAQGKGDVVLENINNIANSERVTYKQIHQVYALKLIFQEYIVKELHKLQNVSNTFFDEKIKKVTSNVKLDEISRFGILTLNSDGDFDFVHRTFAEFFVAQYFINNVDDFEEANDEFTKIKLYIIHSCFYSGKFDVVKNFFIGYFENNSNSESSLQFYVNGNLVFKPLKDLEDAKYLDDERQKLKAFDFYIFANASFHFAKHHKIPQSIIAYDEFWFSSFNFDFINSVFQNWKFMESSFGKETFKFSLELRDISGKFFFTKSFDQRLIREFDEIKSFLALFSELFTRTELQEMYIFEGWNVFMRASSYNTFDILEYFWNFTTDVFNEEGQKSLLMMEAHNYSVLEYSAENRDENSLKFFQKLYENFVEPPEIKNIIETFDEKRGAIFMFPMYQQNKKLCQVLSDFMFKLFSGELERLRKLLIHHSEQGTIFNQHSESKACVKIFTNLLRKTYGDDEEELFESDFDALDNTLSFNLTTLKQGNNFYYNQKNILSSLFRSSKERPMREIFDFLNATLNATDFREFLLHQDAIYRRTALELVALNKHGKSVEFIQKIYEENLTTEEIKKIILVLDGVFRKDPIFFYAMSAGYVETSKALAEFLLRIFENDKITLRKYLRLRKSAIFNVAEQDDKCVKIFLSLLRQTYRDDEEELFQSDFEALKY